MKRDLDVLRDVLLRVETLKNGEHLTHHDYLPDQEAAVTVAFHVWLLAGSDYIEGRAIRGSGGFVGFTASAITLKGFDYLDSIRDVTVWSAVKTRLVRVGGGAPLDVIKAVAADIFTARLTGG